MSVKLLVFDMDGTLLNSEKKITKNTELKLIEMQKKGTRIVLASGRSKNRLSEYAEQLQLDKYGGFIIEANGAGIYDFEKQKHIVLRRMHIEEAEEVFAYLRKEFPKVEILVMGEKNAFVALPKGKKESGYLNTGNMESLKNRDTFYIQQIKDITEEINKVCVFDKSEVIEEIKDTLHVFKDKYWYGRTLPIWLEIGPKEVTKGNGLLRIIERLNIQKEDVYAFGDGENDLSMLTLVNGVAMENAIDTVKAACKYHTGSCDDEGVLYFLNTL